MLSDTEQNFVTWYTWAFKENECGAYVRPDDTLGVCHTARAIDAAERFLINQTHFLTETAGAVVPYAGTLGNYDVMLRFYCVASAVWLRMQPKH